METEQIEPVERKILKMQEPGMTVTVVIVYLFITAVSMRRVLLLQSPLYYEETGSERFSDLPKITYLIKWDNSLNHFPVISVLLRKVSLGLEFLLFFLAALSCLRDLSSWTRPGMGPIPPELEVQSSNHWTSREFPRMFKILFHGFGKLKTVTHKGA